MAIYIGELTDRIVVVLALDDQVILTAASLLGEPAHWVMVIDTCYSALLALVVVKGMGVTISIAKL